MPRMWYEPRPEPFTRKNRRLPPLCRRQTKKRNFILAVIEDTWIRKLREPVTFYTVVSPYELLARLKNICGGLHDLDVLALQN